MQDVRYALRRLRGAPLFAVTAILTLALGIGANTAIFSVVYGVLVRPLPFPDAGRLYAVYSTNRTGNLMRAPVSPVDLDDWRAARSSMEDLGGYWYAEGASGVDLTGRGAPRRLPAVFITPGFLSALGVRAERGRLPREDELVRGGHDSIVLLTHAFWLREFGGSDAVIGSAISLGGRPFDVIGVLPANARIPAADADVFVPYSTIPDDAIPRLRQVRVLNVVARAKAGVGIDAVSAEMRAITARLASRYPEDRAWDEATVVPLAEVVTGPVQSGLLVLLAAVGLVLLMACVNVTNLQLARVANRGRELAVRLALGAGRAHVARLLIVESLAVSALGGAAGIGVAVLGLKVLLALSADQLPRAAEVSVDEVAILCALVLSSLTGLTVGSVLTWRARKNDVAVALRAGGRSLAGGSHTRVRSGLVVAEVAVAMMLVVGAGLMSRSFMALLAVDAGFRPDHLLAVQFTIDAERHARAGGPASGSSAFGAPYTRYYSDVIAAVRALPGVVSAAAVKDPPLRGTGERLSFQVPGRPLPAGHDPPSASAIHVSDGYFKTIGASLAGREFAPADRAGMPLVVVVNEAFAREYLPSESAVGRRLLLGRGAEAEIIGVVRDIRQVSVAEPARPTMYLHNLQNSRVKTTIVARTAEAPLSMADPIRKAIWALDGDQAITSVFTFDDAMGRALARPRLLTVLLGSFGALGLMLGTIGLYGVLAAVVGERRREIGVRLALGAEPGQVKAMVVRRGLSLAGAGIAIGLAGSFGLSRFFAAILYGVAPADPATFGVAAVVLFATAALATWVPASRAARLDPVETLRGD